MLKVLTRRELEFRRHCEEGHMVFRRDCRAFLQGRMKSHVQRRQKQHGSNAFCLSMDLVGPWKLGKGHALNQPATLFLIASRTVLLPNSVDPLGDKEQTGGINADDPTGVDDGDGWMEDDVLDDYEHGVEESLGLERDPALKRWRCDRSVVRRRGLVRPRVCRSLRLLMTLYSVSRSPPRSPWRYSGPYKGFGLGFRVGTYSPADAYRWWQRVLQSYVGGVGSRQGSS